MNTVKFGCYSFRLTSSGCNFVYFIILFSVGVNFFLTVMFLSRLLCFWVAEDSRQKGTELNLKK